MSDGGAASRAEGPVRVRGLLPLLLALPVLVLVYLWSTRAPSLEQPLPLVEGSEAPHLSEDEARAVGAFVRGSWRSREAEPPAPLGERPGLVYVAAWRGGKRLGAAWGEGSDAGEALRRSLGELPPRAREAEVLAVELIRARRRFGPGDRARVEHPDRQGEWGLAVGDWRVSPGTLQAENRSVAAALGERARSEDRGTDELWRGLSGEVLESDLVVVELGAGGRSQLLRRGQRARVEGADAGARGRGPGPGARAWLERRVEEGQLDYLQLPWRGRASRLHHAEREWAAVYTICRAGEVEAARLLLGRVSAWSLREAADGWVVRDEEDAVGLGPQALAALALDCVGDPRAAVISDLSARVDALQGSEGDLRTFADPPDAVGWQRTWPGMAMLWWAEQLRRRPDPEARARLERSLRYYRAWHAEDRNHHQGSVPWMLLAAAALAEADPGAPLGRALVFELADEMVQRQVAGDARAEGELRGRFHDPARPDESSGSARETAAGAAALGVAAELAGEAGQGDRAARYLQARAAALDHLQGLAFDEGLELYAVPRPYRCEVVGGVGLAPGDQRVRSDVMGWVILATAPAGS